MGAVSSKMPCDRDGQNSIGQALPETFANKIRRRVWWKRPPGSLYAFQVSYCLLRQQGFKNRNIMSTSTPYPAGVKPYWVGLKLLVHIIYLGKYGWVEPFFTTLQERWLVKMSPSNLGWPTACGFKLFLVKYICIKDPSNIYAGP